MDVVIPVADEAGNRTLQYAIASILQHAPSLRIVLIGNSSPYVGEGVFHLPLEQTPGEPIRNTDRMMQVACLHPDVTDPFLWSNDDIYWRRPVPLREMLEHSGASRGQLAHATPQGVAPRGIYARAEARTHDALVRAKRPTWDYERHVPLVVHKDRMLSALETPGAKRSMYNNLLRDHPSRIVPDVKLFKGIDPVPDIEAEPFLSTGNKFPIERLPAILGLG